MQAIIMAGGRGSRLMPLTKDLPKPLVPILDKPILHYTIERLKEIGVTDIIMTLGYLGKKIEQAFGDGKDYGVRLRYVYEVQPLGTAGGVKNVGSLIRDDFLVLSGDAFTDMDLEALIRFHNSHRGIATIASTRVPNPENFGNIFKSPKGLITAFEEKPIAPKTNLVNTGIYVFDRKILKYIPGGFQDFSRDIFPKLLGKLYTYETECFWSDVGTLPSYYMTNYKVAVDYTHSER